VSRVVPCGHTVGGTDGQTDTKLIAAFHNFANAPKNVLNDDSDLNPAINEFYVRVPVHRNKFLYNKTN